MRYWNISSFNVENFIIPFYLHLNFIFFSVTKRTNHRSLTSQLFRDFLWRYQHDASNQWHNHHQRPSSHNKHTNNHGRCNWLWVALLCHSEKDDPFRYQRRIYNMKLKRVDNRCHGAHIGVDTINWFCRVYKLNVMKYGGYAYSYTIQKKETFYWPSIIS